MEYNGDIKLIKIEKPKTIGIANMTIVASITLYIYIKK